MMNRTFSGLALLGLASVGMAQSYSEDFQGTGPFNFWSPINVATAPTGERFVGRLANDDLVEFNVGDALGLMNPAETYTYTVSFDLYGIGSLDGNDPSVGEKFFFGLQDGTTIFNESISLWPGYNQSFGGQGVPSGDYVGRTGAAANNTLMLNDYVLDSIGDSTYNLSFTFDATGPVVLRWAAQGAQNVDDESFGVDNVKVSAVPEPGTIAALGLGLGALFARRRRKN